MHMENGHGKVPATSSVKGADDGGEAELVLCPSCPLREYSHCRPPVAATHVARISAKALRLAAAVAACGAALSSGARTQSRRSGCCCRRRGLHQPGFRIQPCPVTNTADAHSAVQSLRRYQS